jgi:hypothetical protein
MQKKLSAESIGGIQHFPDKPVSWKPSQVWKSIPPRPSYSARCAQKQYANLHSYGKFRT